MDDQVLSPRGPDRSGPQLEPARVDLTEHLGRQRHTDADDVVVMTPANLTRLVTGLRAAANH